MNKLYTWYLVDSLSMFQRWPLTVPEHVSLAFSSAGWSIGHGRFIFSVIRLQVLFGCSMLDNSSKMDIQPRVWSTSKVRYDQSQAPERQWQGLQAWEAGTLTRPQGLHCLLCRKAGACVQMCELSNLTVAARFTANGSAFVHTRVSRNLGSKLWLMTWSRLVWFGDLGQH